MRVQLLLAGVAAAAAAAGAASAQPAYNWTGFYVGVNVGGGWGGSKWSDLVVPSDSGQDIAGIMARSHPDGVLGGGQFGYDVQTGDFVFGAEAKLDGGSLHGGQPCIGNYGDFAANCTTHTDFLGDFTARAGWAFGPALVYAKGGFAVGDFHFRPELEHNVHPPNIDDRVAPGYQSTNNIRVGPVVGAGVEYMMAHHWSVGVEYEFQDFGTDRITFNPLPATGAEVAYASPPFSVTAANWTHVVVAKLNFRF
jgi:outer membrane immunogenic protein